MLTWSFFDTIYTLKNIYTDHNRGLKDICHGDIKPLNFVFSLSDAYPSIEIIDYGTSGPNDSSGSVTGRFAGTFNVLPFERHGNSKDEQDVLDALNFDATIGDSATSVNSRKPRENGIGDDLQGVHG